MIRADSDADSPSKRDVFDRLVKDHRIVRDLFEQIRGVVDDEPEVARGLFLELRLQLLAHAHAENVVVYSAFEEIDELIEFVHEGREEHALAERLLDELAGMLHVDDTWEAKMQVLSELVAQHVEEEENEAFPRARRAMSEEAAHELGDAFRRARSSEIEDEPSEGVEAMPEASPR